MKRQSEAMKKITLVGAMLCIFVVKTQAEEPSISVMSFNIYRGGTMRGQPLTQTVKVIRGAKADLVALQEPRSPRGLNTEKLQTCWGGIVLPTRGGESS